MELCNRRAYAYAVPRRLSQAFRCFTLETRLDCRMSLALY